MPEMLNIPKTIYVSDKGVRWTGLNVSEIIPAGETKSESNATASAPPLAEPIL